MALRFRRTLKIAPGIRLNLTKTGVSARVGTRGAGITTGTSGTTMSAGAPGTGLHVSKKLKKPDQRKTTVSAVSEPAATSAGNGFLAGVVVAAIFFGIVLLFV